MKNLVDKENRELPGFTHVYLPDSYVTGFSFSENDWLIRLEAVLLPSHPEYTPPKEGEMYCYRALTMVFPNVEWGNYKLDAPNPEGDHGNIELFYHNGYCWCISGEEWWIKMISPPPYIEDTE